MERTTADRLEALFAPLLDEVERRAGVAGAFVDKDAYRILLGTVWANVVMNPGEAGIEEGDLEAAHGILNARAKGILGAEDAIKDCFRFVNSLAGQAAMERVRLNQTHKDLLLYFASMILDPERHRKWMDAVRES